VRAMFDHVTIMVSDRADPAGANVEVVNHNRP
jgi:hypothetical protein